ncbi:MAG: hypothetical protein ABI180_19255 [Microcoleus sp.]
MSTANLAEGRRKKEEGRRKNKQHYKSRFPLFKFIYSGSQKSEDSP